MQPGLVSRLLTLWLIGNILFITCWDLALIVLDQGIPTVSYFLYHFGLNRPLIWFVLGLCIGHLMIPLHVGPPPPPPPPL